MLNKVINQLAEDFDVFDNPDLFISEMHNYTVKLYDQFSLTKNALFTSRPIGFYETYIPLTLRSENIKINGTKVEKLLEDYDKLILMGSGGSGKTTFLQHILLDCIKKDLYVPVYIELRMFDSNGDQSFENFVATSINENLPLIKRVLEKGLFVFIFDGFDEINYMEDQKFIQQIKNFISNFSKNKFIISSRPGTNVESLSQFYVFEIEPLNTNDIRGYLEKLLLSNNLKNSIFVTLIENKFLQDYLTTPLFLQLYIKYIENNLGRNTSYTSSVFFRNVLDLLFSKHDSVTKLGYVRNRLSFLSKDELELVASMLAFRVLIKSKHMLSKDNLYNEYELIKDATDINFDNNKITYDLTVAVGILVQEGDYYSFPHVLIQEYMASLFISKLDSRRKESVYSSLLRIKHYISFSVLSFLYELDQFSFEKNYLLPLLESMATDAKEYIEPNKNHVILNFITEYYSQRGKELSINDIEDIFRNLHAKYKQVGDNLSDFFSF
ncbi:NACHT domain-containing protein [Aureispira anguillae]|uniref:NACHT domain-containing protein n=1 Tax=Aureispira anguillae TaxID=2864201 RepID=A0A915YH93_9BACT|nr:NACHT domain-containing protein [Aureispira anguillae]BDS13043.1 NACHT domain-containing protein [Aureispira anguillae]